MSGVSEARNAYIRSQDQHFEDYEQDRENKMRTKVRNTSVQAYHSLTDLSKRQQDVLGAIVDLQAACNMNISDYLLLPINSITPRTNELVEMGMVVESHRAINPDTKKRVIYWKVKLAEQVQATLLKEK